MPKFFILTLVLFIMPGALIAKEAPELTLPATADVRIIVDISGSMKKNDPGNLRQPAVRLLARMLPEGTKAGVWTFGQYVNMLVPHSEVTSEWRKTAIERSTQINSVALRTNLGKAIEVANDRYISSGDQSNTHYILLTDGEVDISDSPERNQQEEKRILDVVLPKLIAGGAKIHPVGLSEEADAEFLKQLANVSGGRFQVAENAAALSRAFYEALNSAIPQQQVPIKGNAFTVDAGVSEFTALIFRGTNETGDLALVRPDGKEVSFSQLPAGVRWVKESDYTLITVDEPLAGKWHINGDLGEGSRVTVVSNLKMIVNNVPPSFSQDQPMELRIAFFEGDAKIVNSDFLQVLSVSVVITSVDGLSGTKVLSESRPPENGVYADIIENLPSAGKFTIDVVADGQTFNRKFSAVTEFVIPDEAVFESPIDIALAEQPEAPADVREPTPTVVEPKEASGFTMWAILAAGMVGLFILIFLTWFFLKRRNREDEPGVEEPSTDEPDQAPAVEGTDDPSEEDIPVADSVVEVDELTEDLPEELAEDQEVIPELDELVDEPDVLEKDEGDDEFGLEDFDLSEFDDLASDEDKQKK